MTDERSSERATDGAAGNSDAVSDNGDDPDGRETAGETNEPNDVDGPDESSDDDGPGEADGEITLATFHEACQREGDRCSPPVPSLERSSIPTTRSASASTTSPTAVISSDSRCRPIRSFGTRANSRI